MSAALIAHVREELERAWDRAVALGWHGRLAVRVADTGAVSLIGVRRASDEWDREAFVVSFAVRDGELWVSSQWWGLPEVKEDDLDAVDRVALARMFPDWESWRDARAVKGAIRRAR